MSNDDFDTRRFPRPSPADTAEAIAKLSRSADPALRELARRVQTGDTSTVSDATTRGHISGGDNRVSADEFRARVDALVQDFGVPLKHAHRDARLFRGETLADHGRALLARAGVKIKGGSGEAWQRSFDMRRSGGHGTSDLPALVENIATVAALAGWSSAPASFDRWCRIGALRDYRPESRAGLSAHPTLTEVSEGAEIPRVARGSRAEHIEAKHYSSVFAVSRQLVLGDHAAAIAREPAAAGRAARMTVQREVTRLLTSQSGTGPTLEQDSLPLFHAAHGNYVASSGAAPSVTTLSAARKAMRTRVDPVSGEVLNIVPRVLLVPAALETQARVLAASTNTMVGDAEGDLVVAVDPLLDAVSATAWYLVADGAMFDTLEVAFLQGRAEPLLENRTGWSIDGTDFKISLDFGVACLDFRGMYRNVGA